MANVASERERQGFLDVLKALAVQPVSDAYWAVTHPRDRVMGRGRAANPVMAWPGPRMPEGKLVNQLLELRYAATTPARKPGVPLRMKLLMERKYGGPPMTPADDYRLRKMQKQRYEDKATLERHRRRREADLDRFEKILRRKMEE